MHGNVIDMSDAIGFRPARDLAFVVDDGPEVELYAGATYMVPHAVTAAQAGELELAGEGHAVRRRRATTGAPAPQGGGRTA